MAGSIMLAKALQQGAPAPLGLPSVGVAPTDTIGPEMAKWQAEMQQQQMQQQAKQALMGSVFGLLGAGLGGWGSGGFKKFW